MWPSRKKSQQGRCGRCRCSRAYAGASASRAIASATNARGTRTDPPHCRRGAQPRPARHLEGLARYRGLNRRTSRRLSARLSEDADPGIHVLVVVPVPALEIDQILFGHGLVPRLPGDRTLIFQAADRGLPIRRGSGSPARPPRSSTSSGTAAPHEDAACTSISPGTSLQASASERAAPSGSVRPARTSSARRPPRSSR